MSEAAAPAMPARFVGGSTMRHVAVMTFTGAWYGAIVAGPEGVLAGTALGSVVFGLASVAAAYRIVGRMAATTA